MFEYRCSMLNWRGILPSHLLQPFNTWLTGLVQIFAGLALLSSGTGQDQRRIFCPAFCQGTSCSVGGSVHGACLLMTADVFCFNCFS